MKLLFKDAGQRTAWLLLVWLMLLGGVKVSAVFAKVSEPSISLAAKKAHIRGLSAADQEDWELAIKYFGEAREEAPTWPDVLYNLAYAHQLAGGRELIAIAWYQAYLAAAPGADDTDQVRAWIVELEVKFEAKLLRLIQRVKENAGLIKDRWSRADAHYSIVIAHAQMGDIAEAKETASLIPDGVTAFRDDVEFKDYAREAIVKGQCDVGDFAGAKETVARITGRRKFIVYKLIAVAHAEVGDIAGARETAARIPEEDTRAGAFFSIVRTQCRAGDIAGAKETAAMINVDNAGSKEFAYNEIAFAQAKKGSYSEVDRAQAQVEEIESWTSHAIRIWGYRGSTEELEDWQGFLESLNDDVPDKVVQSLSEAVFKMGYALNKIRKEVKWQRNLKPESPYITLRSSYRDMSKSQVQSMSNISIREKIYPGFDGYSTINHSYDLKSINGDKVVIDHATGLMWHQSGSEMIMTWDKARDWIRNLNSGVYAGCHDWRLPTVEEASSLLESSKKNGVYIYPIFSNMQSSSWTGDECNSEDECGSGYAWCVLFSVGSVCWNRISDSYLTVRPVRSVK
ncbi:MAG: Lcl domain-containing protein [Candidatus Scalindua sp.]